MGASTETIIDSLRQPEYTGENRCIPCTTVNVVIAAAVSGAIGYFSLAGGGIAFVACLAAIYFRGYLVPGTPTLTKRYFPDWLLAMFDKQPGLADAPVAGESADIDPEPILRDVSAIEVCMDGTDLCATDEFQSAWREEIMRLRDDEDAMAAALAGLLDTTADEVSIVDRTKSVLVRADGAPLAHWESKPALVADVAAIPELERRHDSWNDLDLRVKGRLLNGLRVFLESCPACDGPVEFSRETVESCCRSMDVIALACGDCEERLLEVEA